MAGKRPPHDRWACTAVHMALDFAHRRTVCRGLGRLQRRAGSCQTGGLKPGLAIAVANPLPIGPVSSNIVATPVATPAWL